MDEFYEMPLFMMGTCHTINESEEVYLDEEDERVMKFRQAVLETTGILIIDEEEERNPIGFIW